MLGAAVWGRRFWCGERRAFGVRFAAVTLRPGSGRDVRRAARYFAACGVRFALCPAGLEAALGVELPPPGPLQRANAARLLRLFLRAKGVRAAKLYLAGEGATEELCAAARALCPAVRYLRLDVERGGEALSARLRRELGVAAELGPVPARLGREEAALLFAPRAAEAGEGTLLALEEPLAVTWQAGQYPVPAALAAALHLSGAEAGRTLRPRLDRRDIMNGETI